MQLLLRVINRRAAIHVRRSADFLRNIRQPHTFAEYRIRNLTVP